ncbi:MAG: hypothetical protein HY902_04550 [Deltaproteobacteria bacterium]|nr:hypothetical protein [Deltaproteobacteria bacterium]
MNISWRSLSALLVAVSVAACGTSTNSAAVSDTTAPDADSQGSDTSAGGDSSTLADTQAGADATADAASDVGADVQADSSGADVNDAADSAVSDAADDALADTATDAGSDGTGGYSGAPIALEEFTSTYLKAMCSATMACPGLLDFSFSTAAGCEAMLGSLLMTKIGALIGEVKQGLVVYDPVQAGLCVAALTASCTNLVKVAAPMACDKTFVGALAAGATCAEHTQCSSGWCAKLDSNCDIGKCTNALALGAKCTANVECGLGNECGNAGVCAPKFAAQVGAGCGPSSCAAGLYCDDLSMICGAPKPAGGSCLNSGQCQKPNVCIPDAASQDGVCGPPLALGAYCKPTFGTENTCAPGLACVSTDQLKPGTCMAIAPLGAPCIATAQCGGWDAVCRGAAGKKTCQTLPTKGQPCSAPDYFAGEIFSCLGEFECVSGVCADLPVAGSKCPDTGKCPDGLICDDAAKICKLLPGAGAPCSGMCKPGFGCKMDSPNPTCVALKCM